MAETRVVGHGKVYRQMFDAQAKLSLALHECRTRRAANAGVPLQDSASTPRQPDFGSQTRTNHSDDTQSWDRMRVASRSCLIDKEHEETLPDVVVAEKLGSDINERLIGRRQRRHTQAMAELQTDLAAISVSYEIPLKEAGENFLSKMSQCDETMEKLMQKMVTLPDLVKYTLQGLQELWNHVAEKAEDQRKWIRELDAVLEQYESERTTKITALLKKYSAILEKISYMMPPDIHRLIDGEAMMINQAVLANRRAVARLIFQLTEKHLQKGLLFRLHWEDKVQDWTRLKLQASTDRFRKFMANPLIQMPQGVQDILDSMHTKQEELSESLRRTLQEISSLVPPNCSMDMVSEWHSSLTVVNKQIDSLHIDSLEKICLYYESTWQECFGEVQIFKEEVVKYGLPADEVEAIVKNELLPEISRCQSQAEEQLKAIDKDFESLAKRADRASRSLLRFVRGAVLLWEVHGARLQMAERGMLDRLEEVRKAHHHENQKKEAHLDMMVDKLRQESSEETLKVTLDKVFSFLEDIKNGYSRFYSAEVDTVKGYPPLVLEEMYFYSSALSLFFSVKETYHMDSEDLCCYFPSINLGASMASEQMESERPTHQTRTTSQTPAIQYPQSSADLLFIEDSTDSEQESSASQMMQAFTTSRGNTYHASFRMFQPEEMGPSVLAVELLVYPSSFWHQLQKDFCVRFFDHIEDWYHTALTNAIDVVAAKTKELQSELDLRLCLHETRVQRVEKDVHNVRAEELVLHQECVDRHCQAVLLSLSQCSTDLEDMKTRQDKQSEDFQTQVNSMEDKFNLATNSDVLLKLCNSLQSQLEKHTSHIQTTHQYFREETEAKIGALREANAQFVRSFRLFSEGGNFTPKETEVYQRQLEKLAKRINSTEEAIAVDAEKNEFRCMQQAKDFINKFQDRFQFLAVDLKFSEKLQRVFTTTQVQIKSEAVRSAMQKKKLQDMLIELGRMITAHARPSPAEKAASEQDLISYTWLVNEELRKRFQYLDCFPESPSTDTTPVSPLQQLSSLSANPSPDSLQQPGRVALAPGKDVVVGVVQRLLRMGKLPIHQKAQSGTPQKGFPIHAVTTSQQEGAWGGLPPLSTTLRKSPSTQRMKKLSKLSHLDKRFQVFGPSPVEQGIATFKGQIINILWKANDLLLLLAEEFYKKEQGPVLRLQVLPETFELCANEVNCRLLFYYSQAKENHGVCLQELYIQLRDFEEHLAQVVEVLISNLGKQHIEALDRATKRIRENLKLNLRALEGRKAEHNRKLSARLSHPAFQEELDSLLQAEEDRHREETGVIRRTKRELQACATKHGDEFVAALASLTERLLLQMDSLVTLDDIQAQHPEIKMQTVPTLLYTNGSGDEKSQIQKAFRDRTWPGLSYLQPASEGPSVQTCQRSGSVTTAKTSPAHLKTMEASEALYQRFEQRFQEELTRAEEEMEAQLRHAVCWQIQWQDSIRSLKRLLSP